jgi:flagellar M-ring protein FliF
MLIVVRPIMRNMYATNAVADDEQAKAALSDGELSEDDMRMIQIGEGESLEEIKAKLKPKKSSISMDMLDTANTYDDKVALIRMLVAEDSGRVANVLKGMIKAN